MNRGIHMASIGIDLDATNSLTRVYRNERAADAATSS